MAKDLTNIDENIYISYKKKANAKNRSGIRIF